MTLPPDAIQRFSARGLGRVGVGDAAWDQQTCTALQGTYVNGFCMLTVQQAQAQCVGAASPGVWNSANNTCTNSGVGQGVVYSFGNMQCDAGNGTWTESTSTCTNTQGQTMVMTGPSSSGGTGAASTSSSNTSLYVALGGITLLGLVVFVAESKKKGIGRR